MNLFRNLLFWIALALARRADRAVAGAGSGLRAGPLRRPRLQHHPGRRAADAGRRGGVRLWLVWKVLSLPFVALRRHRKKQARARLTDGLLARGTGALGARGEIAGRRPPRATMSPRSRDSPPAAPARERGDAAQARQHADALAAKHPAAHAIAVAELAARQGRHADALAALDAPAAQPLPPRGLALRAQTLAALGRAGEAYGLLGALRQQQALPPDAARRTGSAMGRSRAARSRRRQRPRRPLGSAAEAAEERTGRSSPPTPNAPRRCAGKKRRPRASKQALDARWDESLADALRPPAQIGRLDARRANAERWLQARPGSPALLLTLARLARAQGQWPQAEGYLHRALAQGAGSEAWEELGHGFADAGDEARARLCYVNALRASRGEAVTELPGRDLRQRSSTRPRSRNATSTACRACAVSPVRDARTQQGAASASLLVVRRPIGRATRASTPQWLSARGSPPRPCRRRCRSTPGSGRRRAPSAAWRRWRRCARRWRRRDGRPRARSRSG